MNRGKGYQNIFNTEAEYYLFLETLEEAHTRFGVEIHSYCLMSNHYHLLIKTPYSNLSRAMRHINGVYTQRYNRLNKTDGPLFRGRFKSIIVESDSYLIHLSKYIHLNPIKAKLVGQIEKYFWSSYLAYIGVKAPDKFLFLDDVFGQISSQKSNHEKYKDFMLDLNVHKEVEEFFGNSHIPVILGSQEFKQAHKPICMQLNIPKRDYKPFRVSLDEIVRAVSKYFQVDENTILIKPVGKRHANEPRKIAMFLSQQMTLIELKEIASFFNLTHYSAVTTAKLKVVQKMKNDPAYNKMIEQLVNSLY